ncbi:MAG: O-antigen polymerase [Ramlibacter sp.]|nr:O-antigen polymerase [Ramlibacter sp.]
MARKRRATAARSAEGPSPASVPQAAASHLPPEPAADGQAFALLAAMVLVAPAVGVPGEEMLQDTLKSIVVAFSTLLAALLFLLAQRERTEPLRWHAIVWLPLLLAAYALGSMGWSHTYLGAVEAVRWFIFSVIVWLGLNTLARGRLATLAWCLHAGALIASLWAVLQFWFAMDLFPQGPNPGSTFINRNFFAEFVVCTLPFAGWLLARARSSSAVVGIAASIGFVIAAILMTGTRAALIALWLQVLLVWPLIAWRCRRQLAWPQWGRGLRLAAPTVVLLTALVLALIPSNNPKILEEGHGGNALQRGLQRTQSIGPQDHSLGVRMVMWRATLDLLRARPLSGVGAGAWESEIPLYQAEGSQLETDFYVHNEFLQLVAEYGLVGWAFLLLLLAYLCQAAWRTWRDESEQAQAERPLRAVFLCSLLALMVVSNIGFPWRMAATGAVFALCLGGLAASDARLGLASRWLARPLRWSPRIALAGLAGTVMCLGLAIVISQRAADAERKLVTAAKAALTLSATGDPNNPRYAQMKRDMLRSVREGIALNPHYRKITPMVADELARWGDWANATWIWESVTESRPYVVAILTNTARGYSNSGRMDKAFDYLERAKKIQPNAASVRSLEVILTARQGEEARALQLAQRAVDAGIVDYDLVNTLYILAWRAHDYPLARRALQRRMAGWPDSQARGHVQLGVLAAEEGKDPAKGLEDFRKGLALAAPREREVLLQQVPAAVRPQLSASVPQTSASSR